MFIIFIRDFPNNNIIIIILPNHLPQNTITMNHGTESDNENRIWEWREIVSEQMESRSSYTPLTDDDGTREIDESRVQEVLLEERRLQERPTKSL